MDSTTSTSDAIGSPTLLFRVGGTTYGCDVGATQEVVPVRPSTRLPGAPPFVRGLINVRGTLVTVLDLRPRLDPAAGPTPVGGGGSIILVRHGERLVGVLVEEVLDVRVLGGLAATADEADEADVNCGGGAITRGVVTADGRPVIVLDLGALIGQVLLV